MHLRRDRARGDLTLHYVTQELSRVTGRTITYHAETLEEAYTSRASYGAPEWEVEGWVTSYAAISTGEMNVVSDTVSELTGHAPMTFADFLRRHPESFQHLLVPRDSRRRVLVTAAAC